MPRGDRSNVIILAARHGLSRRLAAWFDPDVRRRGLAYYHQGRVVLASGTTKRVHATVKGMQVYEVELIAAPDGLDGSCTCPFWDDGAGEPCKHQWAAVLAAERAGLLGNAHGPDEKPRATGDDEHGGGEAAGQAPRARDGRTGRRRASDARDRERERDDRRRDAGGEVDAGDDGDVAEDADQEAGDDGFAGQLRESLRVLQSTLGVRTGATAHSRRGRTEGNGGSWLARLEDVARTPLSATAHADAPRAAAIVRYEIVLVDDRGHGSFQLHVATHLPGKSGGTGPRVVLNQGDLAGLQDAGDRRILALLSLPTLNGGTPAATENGSSWYRSHWNADPSGPGRVTGVYTLSAEALSALLPDLCATGRCSLRPPGIPGAARAPTATGDDALRPPLAWDDGPPWRFTLRVVRDGGRRARLEGVLLRADASASLETPVLLHQGGLVFLDGRAARFDHGGAFAWVRHLRQAGPLVVPAGQVPAVVRRVLSANAAPPLELPDEWRFEEVAVAPRPRLHVTAGPNRADRAALRAKTSFRYVRPTGRDPQPLVPIARAAPLAPTEPIQIETTPGRGAAVVPHPEAHVLFRRDLTAEQRAVEQLAAAGFRPPRLQWERMNEPGLHEIAAARLPAAVRTLVAEGWTVEADGAVYRGGGAISMNVRSGPGLDWFDLEGVARFDGGPGATAPLPRVLEALRRRATTVVLDDGTLGLLPEHWLDRFGLVAGAGEAFETGIRFRRSQVGLLDALLAMQPETTFDAAFDRARAALAGFERVLPADPPAGFAGTLRPYQKDGLGWLLFLDRLGLGGCLADDMGLGKTVQVLALLEMRRTREARREPRTSLVVAPRSVLHVWRDAAARFAPALRLLDHTGVARLPPGRHFDATDVVVTTYGTFRRDAPALAERRFDYLILDEAQAVKNERSESAKAARLVAPAAAHRLALSGTPVENHLGELWSIFEVLNPGMLGRSAAFEAALGASPRARAAAAGGELDDGARALLRRAIRPVVLRRTKAQVAPELPARTEQTLYCELGKAERALYDELRAHYRASLLARLERDGLGRAKVHVLEALLRLRQAACHPGLLDPRRAGESSAKLDALVEQLDALRERGSKALVFSQFTSFLAIVRARLDAASVPYEYLDGRTRDREGRVARFQQDPACPLFLVSLKAGGLGLTLTAADYVFLLDPWWNPAVEAQAIDRAHRIGQTRPVFAYRLLARDTVEEKVAELQARKRALADALFGEEGGVLRELAREDLELLLS